MTSQAEIPDLRTPAEPSSVRLIASLAITGLFSGLILCGVFVGTKPRIERNRREALHAAILNVLPGTTKIEKFAEADGVTVYAGRGDDGSLIGYAVPAAGPGFMDTIELIYGFDPLRGVIVGMEILTSKETPGLGDKIASDPDFLANFEALEVTPSLIAVRGSAGTGNEVDCITGATISSEAVVALINRSLEAWRSKLTAEGGE